MILKPPKGAMVNRGSNFARGLVGCWLMNEGGGNTVADLSGNGNTGTLVSDTHFVGGKFGPAINTGTVLDNVAVPNSPGLSPNASQSFTVLAWVKILNNTHLGVIARMEGVDPRWYVRLATDGTLLTAVDDAVDVASVATTDTVDDGIWHQVGFVFNRGTNDFTNIIDGKFNGQNNSIAAIGSLVNNNQLELCGSDTDINWNLEGLTDHIKIYNRALSASEILNLYRSPFCMFEVDL